MQLTRPQIEMKLIMTIVLMYGFNKDINLEYNVVHIKTHAHFQF